MRYRYVFTQWFERNLRHLHRHNPRLRRDLTEFLQGLDAEDDKVIPCPFRCPTDHVATAILPPAASSPESPATTRPSARFIAGSSNRYEIRHRPRRACRQLSALPVSYTHLDVYKRQPKQATARGRCLIRGLILRVGGDRQR